jgi:hypothetical protein
MTSRPDPQCIHCKHWTPPDSGDTQTCTAFPEEIPERIWLNQVDHRQAVRGDHGIRWEPDGHTTFPEWALAAATPTAWLPVPLNIAPEDIDLDRVQRDWERRLDDLIEIWGDITARQRDQIVDQVRSAITSNDLAAIAALTTSTAEATQALTEAMTEMALSAAKEFVREAREQEVAVEPVASDSATFAALAGVTTALLAEGLTNSAGREALRMWSPSTSGDEVSEAVREHLESLSDSFVRDNLGASLTSAQNTGRVNTMLSGPSAALYASEVMDKRTCGPCSTVNGKWIGNTDDPDIAAKIEAVYPNGGYRNCQGGVRCRGTIVAVYRPEQVSGEEV